MKSHAVALALTLLSASSALAADLPTRKAPPMAPPAPVVTWTGFYIGVEGGDAFAGRSNQTDSTGLTSGNYDQSGPFFGGTIGYNWQMTNVVAGLEADLSWANISGSNTAPNCTGNGAAYCFTTVHWLNTDRARLGYSFGQFLPYVTGGLAVADIRAGQGSCAAPWCGEATRAGWTIGAGVEAKLTGNLSAKVEYLYSDFGNPVQYTVALPVRVPESFSLMRVGLNYTFN